MKAIKTVLVFSMSLILVTGLSGCKDKSLSARALANALADEFSDGLEFENEELVSGAPIEDLFPSPSLMVVNAPNAIGTTAIDMGLTSSADYDTWFAVDLQADATIDPVAVDRAIVHVMQANKDDSAEYYRVVTPTNIAGSTMTLSARMNFFEDVPGNAFHVRIALLNAAGTQVSNWFYWNIVTYTRTFDDSTKVPMCDCYEEYDQFPGPDGEMYTDDDTFKPVNSPLRLVDRSACLSTSIGQQILDAFSGHDGTSAPYACSDYSSSFSPVYDYYLYPSGTRWFPYWYGEGEDIRACQMEIKCRSHYDD